MRIAVVGGGVSGLVAAHALHPRHEVTVFEADARLGGHTHTVRCTDQDGEHEVDTGFIVFNNRNYPNFERLLAQLGVASQRSDMSFGVSDGEGDFEYASSSPNAVFARRAHLLDPRFLRMLADLPRFQRAARATLETPGEERCLGEWLEDERLSRTFVERLIVPQIAAVWSAEPRQLWSFPVRFMARFFDNHGMLGLRDRPAWRVVRGGSTRYVEALARGLAGRIRLGSPVVSVTRGTDEVRVAVAGARPENFDRVILATHSDQALGTLSDATSTEREILGAIPYSRNEIALHTDARLMPRRRRAWASWNYHLGVDAGGLPTVTYDMNRLQSLRSRTRYLVTLNRSTSIDPARIIRRLEYAHPVYTPAGLAAQARVAEISGRARTHFCGAYWGSGFHEDGVVSGLRAAREIEGVR